MRGAVLAAAWLVAGGCGSSAAPDDTPAAPSITRFAAAPQTLPAGGGEVTLSWEVARADRLSIAPGVGVVTGASRTVTVGATTTYTLRAENACCAATADVTVTVGGGGDVQVELSPRSVTLAPRGTQQFSATVTGTAVDGVTWSATGGQITAAGAYTAPDTGGGYIVRATSVADPTRSAAATVMVTGGVAVVEPFYREPYAQIMTPMPGAVYFAPATVRVFAHAPYAGRGTVNNYAPEVDFYLGTTKIGTVTRGPDDPIDEFIVTVTGVAAGSYELYARAVTPEGTFESVHVPITVIDAPPRGGPVLELAADRVLGGGEDLEIIGTPSARALITSANGARIRSAPGWSGRLTIRNADVIGLGAMDVSAVDVTVRGQASLEISGAVFDRCGPLRLGADEQATIVFGGNTIRPNALVPVNAEADYAGSHPSITFTGSSTAAKTFQGNNVGLSFVRFLSRRWTIGGDSDAEGNVLIGVRATLELDDSADNVIRGNFVYHRYPYGWSQGQNLQFLGSTQPIVVEHNVFRGSSWMIQGMDGEFRYNLLVDNINEAFFRYTAANTRIHHNVLVNVGYQRPYYPSNGFLFLGDGTQIYNNTIDAGGRQLGWVDNPVIRPPASGGSVRNNVITGLAYDGASVAITGGLAYGDYNCFHNPDAARLVRYEDGGKGAHDCGGGAGAADPRFAQARVVPFPFSDGDIWARRVTVSQILAFYRALYTPLAGSPVIDHGDPADDTGGARNTDIGAIGAGNAHPDDRFGSLGVAARAPR